MAAICYHLYVHMYDYGCGSQESDSCYVCHHGAGLDPHVNVNMYEHEYMLLDGIYMMQCA